MTIKQFQQSELKRLDKMTMEGTLPFIDYKKPNCPKCSFNDKYRKVNKQKHKRWFSSSIEKAFALGKEEKGNEILVNIKTGLLGAIARGWYHKKTAHLTINSDLAIEIEKEVLNLLKNK